MNLNFYAKTMNLLVSLKKTMALSLVTFLIMGSASAQLQIGAGALNFDGINDNINVPLKSQLNISSAITIEAWINPTNANIGTRKTEDVFCKSTSSINTGYIFPRTSSGWKTVEFLLYINGYGWKSLAVPYGVDKLGQWHHLAATYDGVKMVIYIDGAQAGQFSFAGSILTNNNSLTVGNQPGYNEYYEGSVDEGRIWNRALPQCEIANNMTCELGGTQNGLAAYYKFNQGFLNILNSTENQLVDASPTHADGTLNNFTLAGLLSNWSAGIASGTCSAFVSPNVTATADKTLLPIGGTIQLHATGGDTYSWTGPNGFTSTDQNPVITGAPTSASGLYTVVATTGGCSGTASVNVTVALMASGLNFDGVTNSITVPYKPDILNTNAFTIESWVFPTSSNTIIQDVVSNTVFRGTSGVRFPKTNDRWTTFSFDLYINGELKTLTANFPAQALGQWNHLAATYDGYYMRVYLNGNIAGSLEVYGTVDNNTNNFTIGNQEGRGEFFKGSIDELRIWSRALSQCEIINNMQICELNGDNDGIAQQTGLAAYYRFNQGLIGVNNASFNILADSSGHGNNGTLNNFALNGSSSNWVEGKVYGICAYFPPPLLAASANGSAFQTGSDAKLFAVGGNNAYAWTGPSSFQSNIQNPVLTNVQPSNSGTYTVTATYVNCVVNASTRFSVGNVSPIIADGPTAICPSGSVGLSIPNAGSTATYQWFKNGVAIPGATSFQYLATLAGNYTVTTTVGTDVIVSASTTVTIVPDLTAPVANVATLPVLSILVGETVTAIPTATDNCRGVVNGTADRSLTFNTPGTFTITWTYDDLNGNRTPQTQTVNVVDNIAPVLSVPAGISVVGTTGICSAVVGFAATATDNSGGTVTITYSQNPNTAFAVGVTTVTVTATDASNNSTTGSFTITVTPPAVAPITGVTTICAGGTSNLASATAGGTWSSDNTAVATINASGVVTAQSLGTATITYTDACGTSVTTIVTVNAIPSTPNISVTDNCGSSVLTTDATGTLLWSTNATAPSITVTTAGTYTVTQKLNGCTSAAGSAVAAPIAAPAVPSVSVTQPTCAVSTGTLVVNSPAGLSYSIDGINYQSGNTFSGLAAGSYTVSVKNGTCVTTSANPIVINAQPVTPAAPVVSVSQPTCAVSTGTIVVNSPSGFSYSLDGVTYQQGTSFTGVATGTYTVYAKNGSCVSAGSSPVTVNAQPASPSAPTVSVSQPTCAVSTGTIVVTAPAGLSYSLDGVTYQSGTTFTGLATGSYTVYVNNGNCVTTSANPVVVNAQPVTPAAPVASVSLQPSCSVATGTIVVSTPSGFSYSLDGTTYQSGTTFTAVAPGTYTLYARNGSCVSAGSSPVTVNAQPVTPAAPVVSVTDQPTCSVATGTIVVSSPSGFSYSLNGGAYQTSNIFSGVAAGTYTVSARNGSCVSALSNAVTINAQPVTPAAPVVSVTAQPTCSVATGIIQVSSPVGFTYSLDGINYQTSTTFNGVAAGTYTVIAKNGSCVSVVSNAVTVNAQPTAPAAPVVSIAQPTCAVATASITINSPIGAGFTYSLDGTTYQAGTSYSGLTANRTYTVYVKNASGCVTTASAIVNAQPATPVVGDITGTTNFAVGTNSTLSSSTPGGVWSSSNTAVATVNASGVVTGVSIGSATITYTVTTDCSSSKSAAVTIVSACVTPVFTAINNINTTTVSGCTAPVSYSVSVTGNPTLSYTFTGATVASGAGTGTNASFNTGVTTVTVKAVNACGNVTTTFTVTVRDATAPSAVTKNISVPLDANGQVTITPSQVDNGSSDNCGNVTLAFRTGAATSVTTGTICATADENGNLVLTAPSGGIITSINFASYGTPTGTCGSFTLGACNASNSKTIVEGYAIGKNSVTIPANNNVFGDPCYGTVKRLYVQATYQMNVGVNATTTASSLTFGCSNKGANTVTLNVTDAAGNVSTQTAIVTVVDNTAPVITTAVANQSFCGNAGSYTIPVLSASDNCSAAISYAITGATSRTGTGNNASGIFNTGVSLITWSVTDGTNTITSSTTVTVTTTPPAGTITANSATDFCGEFILTGSSTVSNASYKWMSGTNLLGNGQQLSLGQNNADGTYQMYVVVNGCTSPATNYNFSKQNLLSSYTILAYDDVKLGQYSKVNSGSIGVMTVKGKTEFKSYTSVNGPNAFVKSPDIDLHGYGINIPNLIDGVVSIALPAMQYNTASANYLPNYTTAQYATVSLSSNYNKLTIKKGTYATVSGTTFGTIELEEGASIRFTAATLNIDNLIVDDGARDGYYSYVRFAPNSSVRVSTKVSIGSQVLVNPDNNKVTFYMGDNKCDQEKFQVKGADTKIIANIYMPNGKLKVTSTDENDDNHGNCDHKAHYWWNCKHSGHDHKNCDHKAHNASDCNDDVYMTGLFIVEDLESKGNTVIWNSFDCGSSAVPVVMVNKATATQSSITQEGNSVTKSPEVTTEEELKITVMPNPSTTYFTLKFESKYETPVNMRVMDASGRVVDAKSKIGSNSTIQIGANYVSGTYYAEMIQGTQRKVVQLMKVK